MAHRDIYPTRFDEPSRKHLHDSSCPECSGDLRTDGGEISCQTCGLITDEHRIDHGPEWCRFEDETHNPSRTGAPLTTARHDRGLSSEIGYHKDGNGNPLSSTTRWKLARLRRHHRQARWQTKAERNLAHACGEIARLASALDLPDSIREEACMLYRRAQKDDLVRGRSIELVAAGSLYAACRCRGYPRTLEEVATVARCQKQQVALGYRVLNVELGLEAPVTGVTEWVPRLASDCDTVDRVRHRAFELARVADQNGISNGRHPAGVAAACLYLAGREFGHHHTQAELADLANISVATLRERYYELCEVDHCSSPP